MTKLRRGKKKKRPHSTLHSPTSYYRFCSHANLSPRSLCNDSSEKPHHSDILPTPPVTAEHLLCLAHAPGHFGGQWHLLAAASLCETIRKIPWPSLPEPQAFIYWNSTCDLTGRLKTLRCLSGFQNYGWWTWKFCRMKQAGFFKKYLTFLFWHCVWFGIWFLLFLESTMHS